MDHEFKKPHIQHYHILDCVVCSLIMHLINVTGLSPWEGGSMIKRLLVFVAGGLFLLSASGCLVAESTYLKKVEEADGLSKELAGLQQAHNKLSLENAALKSKFKRLTEDAAVLTADKKQLENILRAKSDTLSKNIIEMHGSLATLSCTQCGDPSHLRHRKTVRAPGAGRCSDAAAGVASWFTRASLGRVPISGRYRSRLGRVVRV